MDFSAINEQELKALLGNLPRVSRDCFGLGTVSVNYNDEEESRKTAAHEGIKEEDDCKGKSHDEVDCIQGASGSDFREIAATKPDGQEKTTERKAEENMEIRSRYAMLDEEEIKMEDDKEEEEDKKKETKKTEANRG